jgi:hypothetical protein
MTEKELKPFIVQLYTELLTRINARTQGAPSERKIAEGAEMLAYQFILDMEEAGELDELLSLSREEITELFNNGDFRKQH